MSTVVPLLERLARTPYRDDAYAEAVAGLEPELRDALLGADPAGLARALGLAPVMACMVMTPDGNEPQPLDPAREDEPADPDGPEREDG